jgi:protein-S-isoprenylcysteine O-methyltransferase Ste14
MRLHIPPPVVTAVAAALMWASHRWTPLAHWIEPPWNRIGGLVAVAGVAIAVAAIAHFRRVGTTVDPTDPSKSSRLVTDGVFRASRNPMYLALLLLLIGWAIWLGSATPWLGPPLFVVVLTRVQIIPEEVALRRRFGQQYVLYQQRVARWIGRRR